MPTETSAPPSATETQAATAAAQTAQAVTDSQTKPPQQAADADQRGAIQQKYDSLYGAPQGTATAAPVTQAQPTAQPVVQPDLTAVINALVAEVKALKASQSVEPKVKPTEADWLALLASGDKEGGEKAMADKIRQLIGNDIQQNAVNQATERINAERQISDFVGSIRAANADILVMEPQITLAAQQRIQNAAAQGKINTPSEYVAVYKEAVNAEIENARALILSIRGQGKLEGQTRTSEVIASSTLQPNQVTQREAAQPQGEAVEDTQGYLARRAALKAQQQGM